MSERSDPHPDEATLDRYRTADLDPGARVRVAAHLEWCAECATALRELEAFAATVGRAYAARREADARQEPDWARLRARIADRTTAERRVSGPSPWLRWAPQAAAAVLALVVIGVLWRQGVREPEDAGQLVRPSTRDVAVTERAEESSAAPAEPPAPQVAAPAPIDARAEADLEKRPAEERDEALDRGANAGARLDQAREEAAAALADGVALDPLARFELEGRAALARSDTAAAAGALELWRDSLAAGRDLSPQRRLAARALADSLADLVAPAAIPPE